MGLAKEEMMRQQERGASHVDGLVCDRCFTDAAIIAYVQANAASETCDYCQRTGTEPIAANADDVASLIMDGIVTEWVNPVEELFYETAEGGYQGQQIDFDEVLEQVGDPIATYEFQEALSQATYDHTTAWCKRDYAAPHVDEGLAHDWDDLVEQVKYESRFFFLLSEPEEFPEPGQRDSALAILTDIAEFADSAGLIRPFPAGTTFWRARSHGADTRYETAADLGVPPPGVSLSSNRMSPAGIPAFYGAEEAETAIAEIRANADEGSQWSAGKFSTSAECAILDLAELPAPPSLFDPERRSLRRPLIFLARFAEQISQPLTDRRREHIDYVPTQVVAEFLRLVFRSQQGAVTGIRYGSAQREGGVCVVLFVPHERCVDEGDGDVLQLVIEETTRGAF